MATTTTSYGYGSITITEVQEGSQIWTTTVAPAIPSYTFTVSNLIGDSNASVKVGDIIMYSYYRYTVLSVSADGTTVFTGNRQGFASTVYQLIVSPVTVIKDKNGVYSPYYVTLTAKSKTGTNTMGNYQGRFKIETTIDNENWETQYTSTLNESTVELDFSELDDIVALRCSLYASGGTSTLLDQQVISVVTDGVDGNDAYTVILTNENHTFAGNTTSALASEIECNVIAYKGTSQVAATIGTITGQPTGMTTSLLNNGTVNAAFRVSVTSSMVTKNGVLNIPITVDNKVFTKKFTYGLALDGEDGKDGGRWYSGISITGTSTTATVFSGSGISSAVIGDMYLNTSTYNTYRCTLGGDASTAKWVYVNNIKGVHGDTGKGVSSITNQYYLSTSNTTQTGGSWSSTVPPYVEDCYYWTKSHIVWTDNTQTDTTAVLDNGLTDANTNAIDARKVATNYLAVDNTGIMIADMEDGEQTPSGILTGKNVFIDSDSVEIREGQNTLSSFGNGVIILGEKDKARLKLTSKSIIGLSADASAENFKIMNGDFDEEKTINEDGTFRDFRDRTDSQNDTFHGSFEPFNGFYFLNNLTCTIVLSFTFNGTQYNSSIILQINGDDFADNGFTQTWDISESDVNSSYTLDKSIQCSFTRGADDEIIPYFIYDAKLIPKSASSSYNINNTASFSIVTKTKKYQNASFTFGSRNDSECGKNSFAIGEGINASSDNQIAVGRYNDDDPEKKYAFMVGNGFYGQHRSNAFAVDWNGHAEMGDIDGYGLQLSENSQSIMNDYINCADVNDNAIFKVAKSGAVNATGTINAPNIILKKPSTDKGDYLLCEDENRNAKFRVLNDGGVIVGNDLLVKNNQTVDKSLTVTGNASVVGNLRLNGRLLDASSANNPLFKVVTVTVDNLTIAYNNGVYPNVAVNATGYTPVAIGSYQISNSTNYTSSYAAWTWAVMGYHLLSNGRIYCYVGNWHSSTALRVKLTFTVLCIKTTAL